MRNIEELSQIISKLKDDKEISQLLNELLSESELEVLSKRWRIIKMLKAGYTQREIAKELKVSLCKVTRGAKIIKDENAIVSKFI